MSVAVVAPVAAAPRGPTRSLRPPSAHARPLRGLVLGAIGVVFGDIGTSPLYTFQECLGGAHGVRPTPDNVLGVLSLIVWAVTLVVTVKYLTFLMRADNHGEGGIMALLALLPARTGGPAATIPWVAVLVLIGAALLFGDGMITPAISVLSAIEGLEVATTRCRPFVVPLTCAILVGLFALQRRGTAGLGRLFGPIMVVWFLTIGLLGGWHIAHAPRVLGALSPLAGARFFAAHGWRGGAILGSVVLAVTGGEALYADMGHFGRRPVRLAWLGLIYPSLLLCYLGQGALILRHPGGAGAPFFGMVPTGFWTVALVALAAPATVIASQALISGVFSLTHQAVQLGYFPRVEIRHTSDQAEGQIYIPSLNWGLAIACVALVLAFERSERLAAAFGLAVSGTMLITSVVFFAVMREVWRWSLAPALAVLALFLSFDVPFVLANLLKFFDGGYLPLLVGAGFLVVMLVWRRGRVRLGAYFASRSVALDAFLAELPQRVVARTPGVAVFMASSARGVPPVLVRLVRRIRVVEETVIVLTVVTAHEPVVPHDEQLAIETVGSGFVRVVARCGFLERPAVAELVGEVLARIQSPVALGEVTYYLGRETFIDGTQGQLGRWTKGLFAYLSRNAYSAPMYFGVPPDQVIELGTQIDL